jgi:hypothetical protein
MSIKIERKKGIQIIRMTSDTVTESDAVSVRTVVEMALAGGIRNFILSIVEKSLADHEMVSNLITYCEKTVKRGPGLISLVVTPADGGKGLYSSGDSSLSIPIYASEDDAVREMLAKSSSAPDVN